MLKINVNQPFPVLFKHFLMEERCDATLLHQKMFESVI